MKKNLPLFIGLRYIRSKRRNGFLSFVSAFSFGAMALGVMALILVLSVMNGFASEIHSRILSVIPHLTIESAGHERGSGIEQWQKLSAQIETMPFTSAVAPYVDGFGMVRYEGVSQGVAVQGIDPSYESAVTHIDNYMLIGDLNLLQPGEFGVVLGGITARKLRVVVGDKIRLTLPEVSSTLAGVFPREKSLRIVGVFQVGAQVDGSVVFVHIADAQKLYRKGKKVQGLRVRLEDSSQADMAAAQLKSSLGTEFNIRSWMNEMGSLFQAMRMEKVIIGLLLSIVVAIAAFNIVANLVLMVAEKRKDIAVIRSMGARSSLVMKIFVVQGTAMGLLGILVGAVIGCILGLWIGDIVGWFEQILGITVFDPTLYFISTLPSQLLWRDVVVVCGGAALMSFVATLYPAWRASRVQPAEALRYDK